jgi:hypothetical protein
MTKRRQPAATAKVPQSAKRRLIEATNSLAVAEHELQLAMGALPVTLRAEKRMIGEAMRLALGKLTTAKEKLDSLLES